MYCQSCFQIELQLIRESWCGGLFGKYAEDYATSPQQTSNRRYKRMAPMDRPSANQVDIRNRTMKQDHQIVNRVGMWVPMHRKQEKHPMRWLSIWCDAAARNVAVKRNETKVSHHYKSKFCKYYSWLLCLRHSQQCTWSIHENILASWIFHFFDLQNRQLTSIRYLSIYFCRYAELSWCKVTKASSRLFVVVFTFFNGLTLCDTICQLSRLTRLIYWRNSLYQV